MSFDLVMDSKGVGMNIREILDLFGVFWVEKGSNVASGNINIACPFCGDDPSQHLGIQESSGWWGCWRDQSHRGRNLFTLLRKLTGLGRVEILERVGGIDYGLQKRGEVKSPNLVIPGECGVDSNTGGFFRVRCLNYLRSRGFIPPESVMGRFHLTYGTVGSFRGRLIIRLLDLERRCVALTGRLFWGSGPRYLSEGKTKNHLSFLQEFSPIVRHIILVEGPMDALKLNLLLPPQVRALGIQGRVLSDSQLSTLCSLRFSSHLSRVDSCLDAGSFLGNQQILSQLRVLGLCSRILQLPEGVKDPGDLTTSNFRGFFYG